MKIKVFVFFLCVIVAFSGCANSDNEEVFAPPKIDNLKPPGVQMSVTIENEDQIIEEYQAPIYEDGKLSGIEEIAAVEIVAQDLMSSSTDDMTIIKANKYLVPGMWISIPVGGDKKILKMVFANIDIFVYDIEDSSQNRVEFNNNNSELLKNYDSKNLKAPSSIQIELNLEELSKYAEEFRNDYLSPFLPDDYVTNADFYYLVPKPVMDDGYYKEIQEAVARARFSTTIEDYVIDGSIFGEWLPMENLVKTKEISELKRRGDNFSFNVHNWPYDDRPHCGF